MGFSRQPSRRIIEAAKGFRHVTTIHQLCDGPISIETARAERASKVARMADILLQDGTYAIERDAARSLFGKFSFFEITLLIDDARQVATQHAVAMEISQP